MPASWAARHGLELGDELLLSGRREGMPPLRIVGLHGGHRLRRARAAGTSRRGARDARRRVRGPVADAIRRPRPGRRRRPGEPSTAVTSELDEPYVVETAEDAAARFALGAQRGRRRRASCSAWSPLVVGAFLVGNTLAMTVGERKRELGLLRAAGTTSRQVLGIVVRQALALGASAAARVVAGIGLAALIIGFLPRREPSSWSACRCRWAVCSWRSCSACSSRCWALRSRPARGPALATRRPARPRQGGERALSRPSAAARPGRAGGRAGRHLALLVVVRPGAPLVPWSCRWACWSAARWRPPTSWSRSERSSAGRSSGSSGPRACWGG